MTNPENGGTAFPRNGNSDTGMTLRDYFAAAALAGIAANAETSRAGVDDQAATAYQYADAMLAHRTKP